MRLLAAMPHGLLCRSMFFQVRRELAGHLLLLEHQVLAHLDDLHRVLDEDRAHLLAGAAGGARPQRVLGDPAAGHARHVGRLLLGGGERGAGRDQVGVLVAGLIEAAARRVLGDAGQLALELGDAIAERDPVEHLVAHVVDQLHRRQVLAGAVGRAVVRAARALGAGVGVEQALPRELLVLADAPLGLVLEVELGQVEGAGRQVAREDVGQRAEQVDVLGVGQVVQERQQDQHVEPVADRRAAVRDLGRQRRHPLAEHRRQRHPRGRGGAERAGVGHLVAVVQEVAQHQRADRAEDQAGVEGHRDERRPDEDPADDRPRTIAARSG
jgi:hypothetical protein